MIGIILVTLCSTVFAAPTWQNSQGSQWNGQNQQWQAQGPAQNTWQSQPQQPWQNKPQPQPQQNAPWQGSLQPVQQQPQGPTSWTQQNMVQQKPTWQAQQWQTSNTWQQPQQQPPPQQQQPQQQGNTVDNTVKDLWPVNNEAVCKDGEFRTVASSDNGKYEKCVGGRWVAQNCAPGTVFDVNSMGCINKESNGKTDGNDNTNLPQQPVSPPQQPQQQQTWQPVQNSWQQQQPVWQAQQPQAQWQQQQPQAVWQPVQWIQPSPNVWQQSTSWKSKTPKPMTPAPMTPAPMTPAPMTPAPMTPAPMTPAPMTPAPMTPAPMTPAPMTPAPTPGPTSAPTTEKPYLSDPWQLHADKCSSGSRRSVEGNNDAFEVCDNGEWVFMLCAPGTWFDTEVMECSDGFSPAPAWPVPKNMVPMVPMMKEEMQNMKPNNMQDNNMDKMMNIMMEMMTAENQIDSMMPQSPPSQPTASNPMMMQAKPDQMQKVYTQNYGNADMMQQMPQPNTMMMRPDKNNNNMQIMPDNNMQMMTDNNMQMMTDNNMQIMPDNSMQMMTDNNMQMMTDNNMQMMTDNNMQMMPDNNMQMMPDNTDTNQQMPQDGDPNLWLNDIREVIIVSVEKCKVGRTREDDSPQNYQECIMNPAGTTMWIRRKCAPGTLFSPWTRNCGKVNLRYNDTDPWITSYQPHAKPDAMPDMPVTMEPTKGTSPTMAPTMPPTDPPTQPIQPDNTPAPTPAPTQAPTPAPTSMPDNGQMMKIPHQQHPWQSSGNQIGQWSKGGVKKDPKTLTITFELKNNGGYYN